MVIEVYGKRTVVYIIDERTEREPRVWCPIVEGRYTQTQDVFWKVRQRQRHKTVRTNGSVRRLSCVRGNSDSM